MGLVGPLKQTSAILDFSQNQYCAKAQNT